MMNNEDKILKILERIEGDVSTLKGDVSTLKGDVLTLKEQLAENNERLTRVEVGITKVEDRISKTEDCIGRVEKSVVVIENDHGKRLGALEDGQTLHYEVLTEIRDDIKDLKQSRDTHGIEIIALKQRHAQ